MENSVFLIFDSVLELFLAFLENYPAKSKNNNHYNHNKNMNLAYARGFPTVSVQLVRHISAVVSGTVAQNFPATGVGVIESFLEMLPHPMQQPTSESYPVGKVHFLRNQIRQLICMKPEIFSQTNFAGRSFK